MESTSEPKRYKGNPFDPNSPAYGRVEALVELYADRMRATISGLPDKRIYAQDPKGVLTPVGSLEEVRGRKGVLMPPPESVDDVVAQIIKQVRVEVPKANQQQVIEGLNKLRPRYTSK